MENLTKTFPQVVTTEKLFSIFIGSMQFLTHNIDNNFETKLDVVGLTQAAFELTEKAHGIYKNKLYPNTPESPNAYIEDTHLALSMVEAILQSLQFANLQYDTDIEQSFNEYIAGLIYINYQLNQSLEEESQQIRLAA